jgi:hypothetical protein
VKIVLLGFIKFNGNRLVRDFGVEEFEEERVDVFKVEVGASAGAGDLPVGVEGESRFYPSPRNEEFA